MNNKYLLWFFGVLFTFLCIVFVGFVASIPVYLGWNCVISPLFETKEISIFLAFGITLVLSFLKSFFSEKSE